MTEKQEKLQPELEQEVLPVEETAKAQEQAQAEKEEQTKNQVLEKYIAKKSFKKKLSYIIALSASFVLAVLILVLACVQVNVMPHFVMEHKAAEYSVYHDNTFDYSVDLESSRYEEFATLYNKAFDMSIFSAMFSGQVGNYVFDEDNETYQQFSQSNITTLLDSQNYLRVKFDKDLPVLNSDRSVYKSIRNPQAEKIYFNEYYIALQEENQFKDIKVIIPVYGNYVKPDDKPEDVALVFTFNVKANLYRFSKAVEDFIQ